ncbi:MAG: right-handed parallel beta-helix repeat-containing protein, partial [Candidatus Binatia bacterium]
NIDGANTNPTFVGVVIRNNRASGPNADGAGAYVTQGARPTFRGCVFAANVAGNQGGGLKVLLGAHATVIGGSIRGNRAGATRGINSGGGGMFVIEASATLTNVTVERNRASFVAGGLYIFNRFTSPQRMLLVQDSRIRDNVASRLNPNDPAAQGGGLHVEDNSRLRIVRSEIRGNDADTGGGITNFRGRLEIFHSIVAFNDGDDPQSLGGFGGGIASFTNDGGRVPTAILTDTAVVGNTARIGGGIYHTNDTGGGNRAPLTLKEALVSDNTTDGGGGGIFLKRAALTMTNRSQVLRNDVGSGSGGGILLEAGGQATIRGSTIASNTATRGGGVAVVANTILDVQQNSRIYGNVARNASGGGGIFVGGVPATGTVSGNVIADNVNYQIAETQRANTGITYTNNKIEDTASPKKIYVGNNPSGSFSTVAGFNSGLSPRASGNTQTGPAFVSFLATPNFSPSFLAWSVARAADIDISNLGNNLEAPTG